MDLLPPAAIRAWAQAAGEGAVKYELHNCLKGIPVSNLLGHALEHITSFLDGDRSEDHLGHTMWNIGMAIHNVAHRPELVDLPPYRQTATAGYEETTFDSDGSTVDCIGDQNDLGKPQPIGSIRGLSECIRIVVCEADEINITVLNHTTYGMRRTLRIARIDDLATTDIMQTLVPGDDVIVICEDGHDEDASINRIRLHSSSKYPVLIMTEWN